MAQVILFGGGDAGGFIISATGVRPIPPFDLGVRLQLRGLSALLAGTTRSLGHPPSEMPTLLQRIAGTVMEEVEGVVGKIDGDHGFVYQDDDGGFSCGSTGKPPIPFPWPALAMPGMRDLLANGVLENDIIDYVTKANEKKIPLTDMLEQPAAVAKRLGIQLSERTVHDLQQLAPSRLASVTDPTEHEIIGFFHKVAADGRYLSTWATRPAEAATALKVRLSDKAFDRILAGGGSMLFNPGEVMNPIAVAVLVGIVIMLVDRSAQEPVLNVIDRSGMAKF